jgi:hypothetical protein
MKTAFELAMERLDKLSPTVKLSDAQKKEIAKLDSQYAAKLAERELATQAEIAKAIDSNDDESIKKLEERLVSERCALRAKLEEKKETVRRGEG